jgi:thiol:disulfide interchange protein DsbD
LGFAFVQPTVIIVLMFLTVGVGLASPYVLLSWHPAWLKFLPKPGRWMEQFKIAMGFPMLATGVWLFSLSTTFYGERSWWLGIFLVFVGAAAWVFGAFVQRGGGRRAVAGVLTLLLLAAGYTWALDAKLEWRAPVTDSGESGAVAHAPKGYGWQRWSADAVAKARADGRPVIVDFTAKWCLTCNISVKPALESKSVIERLKQLRAVALVADYTLYPPAVTEELARFDRTGVPLVLVYPKDAAKPPIVLADPLPYPAPYSPAVLAALDKASE